MENTYEVRQFPSHIMSMAELKEYLALKKKVFGDEMFVEMDWSDPDQVRLNELVPKYQQLRKFVANQIK